MWSGSICGIIGKYWTSCWNDYVSFGRNLLYLLTLGKNLSAWNSCINFVTRGERIAATTQRLTSPRLRLPKRRMLKTQAELWGLGDPKISVLTHTSMWDHVGEPLSHKIKGFWHTWDMFHLLLMDLDTIHDNWSRVVLGWKVLILRNII